MLNFAASRAAGTIALMRDALNPKINDDRGLIFIFLVFCLAASVAGVLLLRRYWKGRKRPLALCISALGVVLALPGYLALSGFIGYKTIPDMITVPLFIAGGSLILTGAFMFRMLQRSGER